MRIIIYIIKWASGDDIEDPIFSEVIIDKTVHNYDNEASGTDLVQFIGTYDVKTFSSEPENSILLLGDNNTLRYAGAGHLGACRAYFKIGDGSQAARQLTSFDIDFGDDVATGVVSMGDGGNRMEDAWYTINGRKLQNKPTAKGLYIHNGHKVVIK